MSKEIERPEDMVRRMYPVLAYSHPRVGRRDAEIDAATTSVLRRDAQIAAWCIEKAEAADREAEAHDRRVTNSSHYDDDAQHKQRAERCEGRAAAFRAIADLLRGLS